MTEKIELDPGMSIGDTRIWVTQQREDGVDCPACDQFVKVYRRKINAGMAQSLIAIYNKGGTEDFVHTPTLVRSHEVGQLSWWGFIEEEGLTRKDGGRAGFWRTTRSGADWLLGTTTAPKYAHVFNGKLLEMTEDDRVTILDALGTKFNYSDLMAGV
jgi:hypothetical protein